MLADPATAGSAELDQLISPSDRKILAELEAFFWQFVKKHYPDLDKSDVILLTASLLFSLLPLHDPPVRLPLILASFLTLKDLRTDSSAPSFTGCVGPFSRKSDAPLGRQGALSRLNSVRS